MEKSEAGDFLTVAWHWARGSVYGECVLPILTWVSVFSCLMCRSQVLSAFLSEGLLHVCICGMKDVRELLMSPS